MRNTVASLLAVAIAAAPSLAQRPATTAPSRATGTDSQLGSGLDELRARGAQNVPAPGSFNFGDRAVPAGRTIKGSVAIARGNLDVYGTVDGDAYVIGGDLRVHPGGEITGDAMTAGGRLVIDGGAVHGEMRSLGSGQAARAVAPPRPITTGESIKLVLGWFAVLVILGIGVMLFAEPNLDGVVVALERGIGRAFWIGLAGEVLALPGLIVLAVALAITILGALLIPFAIVAYVLAAAGLVTLGFLAVSRFTGSALVSQQGTASPRGVHLRALLVGLGVFFVAWMAAAVFTWNPIAGGVLRAIAFAMTWVAATVGLGAAILSRAGTQRAGGGTATSKPTDEYAWQTPTPVTGVAAARRATSTAAP